MNKFRKTRSIRKYFTSENFPNYGNWNQLKPLDSRAVTTSCISTIMQTMTVHESTSPEKFLILKSGTGLLAWERIWSVRRSLLCEARWIHVFPRRSGKFTEAPACTRSWTTIGCLVMTAKCNGVWIKGKKYTVHTIPVHHARSTHTSTKHIVHTNTSSTVDTCKLQVLRKSSPEEPPQQYWNTIKCYYTREM